MEDQQKLQEMMNELNIYKNQAELVQQQIEMIKTTIAEVNSLEFTIEDLKEKDSVEAFVPVGAGAFMEGEIKNTKNIIMSVGAGVAISQTVEEAKENISTQKKELEDSLDKMLGNLQQISDIIGQLSPQVEQLMMKTQGQEF